ncbi:MAG: hypothetical protein JRF43_02045 [Deltaproteobacteria bacterium]|nr:hypothetical protein [Deltaproteobacteria bacterium]
MAKEEFEITLAKLADVKEAREETLLAYPNVVGTGIGFKEVKGKETKELVIVVYVEKKVVREQLAANELIPNTFPVPETLEKIKTDVVEVGRIEAQSFNTKIRPAMPGFSIGHYKITAGTFGCLVKDTCPPCRFHILSNNHVLANSNAAHIGDPILQPGSYDGGVYPADMVARLSRFVPIHFGSPARYNLVDAGLALPLDQRNVIGSVVGLGIPKGTIEATLGMEVIKSGRTTQTTLGKVKGIDGTIAVNYGVGVAYFRNQILTTNMSKGGDSGSLLMSRAEQKATGLLFAGSDRVTIHNNIANVIMALGVEMITA